MKILLVSYYFPPFNAVGAVRTGKLAKYLVQAGHEVKVLSADDQPSLSNLPVEIPEQNITRTRWFDVNKPIQFLLGGKKSVALKGFERAGRIPSGVRKLGYLYKDLFNLPDGQIGWYPYALKAGKKILSEWKPDFILSSSSPHTSFLVAKRLSKLYQIPWIADLRDLWSDNHNSDIYQSAARRAVDRKLEKWVLSTASGLVTVSDPLSDILKRKFDKPIGVITNGYDLEDYPEPSLRDCDKSILKIVYTGIIHPIKRDPAPLFEAMKLLGVAAKKIQIDFYGKNNTIIKKAALDYGIGDRVNCYDTVTYHESLQLQVNADLLLLLTYDSEKENGVITTKFFEYLGAKRPILFLGCINGVAANMIKEAKTGFVSNKPGAIAEFLRSAIHDKEIGKINTLPPSAIQGFSRQEQAKELVAFLTQLQR